VFGPGPMFKGKAKLAWDEEWLTVLWQRVRVGFTLYSSDMREAVHGLPMTASAEVYPYDVVFCAQHDWPGCPIPVLVASRVLGERCR
jgi:hypothetical protein